MRSNSDEIRRRIEKRKKQRERMERKTEPRKNDHRQKSKANSLPAEIPSLEDEERYGFDTMTSYESGPNEEDNHPLFSTEAFIFKTLTRRNPCLSSGDYVSKRYPHF